MDLFFRLNIVKHQILHEGRMIFLFDKMCADQNLHTQDDHNARIFNGKTAVLLPTSPEAARNVAGKEHVIVSLPAPNMAGRISHTIFKKAPGAFCFLSSSNAGKHTDVPHHNPKFNIDEDVLYKGSALFVDIVERFLNR